MAAIPCSVDTRPVRRARRAEPTASGRRGPRANHLRLVDVPQFVEPIFEELSHQPAAPAPLVWSEPEVRLPHHSVVTQLIDGHLVAGQPLSTPALLASAPRLAGPNPMSRGISPTAAIAVPPLGVDYVWAPALRRRVAPGVWRFRIRRLMVGLVLGASMFGAVTGITTLASSHQGSPVVIAGSVPASGGYKYTVRSGDTLWSIAARVYPNGDPRALAAQLGAQLRGRSLQPGEHLLIP